MSDVQQTDMDTTRFIENENNIRNDFSVNYNAVIKMGQNAMWTAFLTNFISLILLCVLLGVNIPAIMARNLFGLVAGSYYLLGGGFLFGCGVVTSMTSFGVTYLSQEIWLQEYTLQLSNIRRALLYHQNYEIKLSKRAQSLQEVATFLVCSAYIFFVTGLLLVLYSIATMLQFSSFLSGVAIAALIAFCIVISCRVYSNSKKDN